MEALHVTFEDSIVAYLFTCSKVSEDGLVLSYMFYAYDVYALEYGLTKISYIL